MRDMAPEPYRERVFEERDELIRRAERLHKFTKTPAFSALPAEEQNAMLVQYAAMSAYRDALETRIILWRRASGAPPYDLAGS